MVARANERYNHFTQNATHFNSLNLYTYSLTVHKIDDRGQYTEHPSYPFLFLFVFFDASCNREVVGRFNT